MDFNKKKIVGSKYADVFIRRIISFNTRKVEELLANTSLWEESNKTQKMISDGSYTRTNISFLEIIRKENDEL